jgi:hypothetical protein
MPPVDRGENQRFPAIVIEDAVWPTKLTREQQKAVKQRSKDFDAALKARARAAGWRYARGEVFRQAGDWFVSVFPSLLWEQGALARLMIKPMALDPLFWDIVGLPENRDLPLSFRATGAWVLRPRTLDETVALDIGEIDALADALLAWSDERSKKSLAKASVQTMLADLPNIPELGGQPLALATCLHILADDLDGAMRLCRISDPDAHPLMREGGGFSTHNRDGLESTFIEQAREWIAARRRGAITTV